MQSKGTPADKPKSSCVPHECCVPAGMMHFEGIPTDKRAVHHELTWFDRNVFRTAAGESSLMNKECVPRVVASRPTEDNKKSKCATSCCRQDALGC
eukprot:1147979-Pelagomonas_calceolata.AAC.1